MESTSATQLPETSVSATLRLSGAFDDPLICKDVAKKERASRTLEDTAHKEAAQQSCENSASAEEAKKREGAEHSDARSGQNSELYLGEVSCKHADEENQEKAQEKQRLVRAVLCTGITVPAVEDVSSSILKAVLRGDADALLEACARKRRKGVDVALTADSRGRTALHLAIGTDNINMVKVLMRWRHEKIRCLEEDMHILDHRRDTFIQGLIRTWNKGEFVCIGHALNDIERFDKWLLIERRRLVRVSELQCEECWTRVATARDYQGQTPLHWACCSVNGTHEILNAVLTIGRADLSARDASHGSDRKIMETTKARFRENLPESKKIISNKTPSNRWAVGSTVFSHGEEFHRQTGELRREVKEKPTASGGTQGTRCPEDKVSRCVEDSTEIGAPYRGYKVTWFCAALAKTAEHISGAERRVRAKAFLFNVFEGFDKSGTGTLSLEEFRKALRDVHVSVTRKTLSEVARHFQARTTRGYNRHHNIQRKGSMIDEEDTDECLLSYGLLVDAVFSTEEIRPAKRREQGHHYAQSRHERDVRTRVDKQETEKSENRCWTDVRRVRAARLAVLDSRDALGRSPLFLASAAGAVPALKCLLRHGAVSTCVVEGTELTVLSVAPNSLTRRVLTAAVRHSLDETVWCRRINNKQVVNLARKADLERSSIRIANKKGVPTGDDDEDDDDKDYDTNMCTRKTPRMEEMIAIVAEAERSSPCEGQHWVDMKTSLHLASLTGLSAVVKDLVNREQRETNNKRGVGADGSGRPGWNRSDSKLPSAAQNCQQRDIAFSFQPSYLVNQEKRDQWMILKPDASGWSALHTCCAEASPEHYRCALALLGSQTNPNLRTNSGRTPLHVAASIVSQIEAEGVGNLIPLLINHSADLEAEDGDGLRPIHVAAQSGHHIALLALLSAGADVYSVTPRRWNAMHYAVVGGHVDAARLLAYWDSDTGVMVKQRNSSGVTPIDMCRTNAIRSVLSTLWEAAARGQAKLVARACLESCRCPTSMTTATSAPWACPGVNSKSPGLEFTPLHSCVAGLAAVKKGVDLSTKLAHPRPSGHRSALTHPSLYACLARERSSAIRRHCGTDSREHVGMVTTSGKRYTTSRGEGKKTDSTARTSDDDHMAACRALISSGANVNAMDAQGRSPLILAAASGSMEIVTMLLGKGAEPTAVDLRGNTSLHYALAYANAAIAAALAGGGVDYECRNKDGKTPQELAGQCALIASASPPEAM